MRTRVKQVMACTILAALALACSFAVPAASPETSFKIALQAKLFFSTSGSFSPDVLASGTDLQSFIKRGDPTSATLVVVAVTMTENAYLPSDSRVRLVAIDSAMSGGKPRTLVDRTVRVGAVDKGGATHLGFWLPDTGCRPVTLKATLSVAREPTTVSTQASIPFGCTE